MESKLDWLTNRLEAIKSVIKECIENNEPIKIEWVREYNELISKIVD